MTKFSEIIQAILDYCLVELAIEELKKELQRKTTTTSTGWNKRQENRSGPLSHEQETASASHDQVLKLLDSLRKMLVVQQQNQNVNAKEINQNGKKNTSSSEESPEDDLLSSDKLTSISRKSVGLDYALVESTSAAAGRKAASSASKSKSSSDHLKMNKSDPQTSSRAAGSSSDNDTSSEILENENTTTLAYLTTEFLMHCKSIVLVVIAVMHYKFLF